MDRHTGHDVRLVSRFVVVSERVSIDTEGRLVLADKVEHPDIVDFVDDDETTTVECLTCGDTVLDQDDSTLSRIKAPAPKEEEAA